MDADHNQADCEECQLVGSRVYTPANVNWGGCPPSKGDIPEAARVLKRDASKNRDEYERRHENASHS